PRGARPPRTRALFPAGHGPRVTAILLRRTPHVSTGDLIHVVSDQGISDGRKRAGRLLIRGSFVLLVVVLALQALDDFGYLDLGFTDWQPTMYACIQWCVCLCVGQVVIRGEQGKRIL